MPAQPRPALPEFFATLSDEERAFLRQFVAELQHKLELLIFASEYFDEANLALSPSARQQLHEFILDYAATQHDLRESLYSIEPVRRTANPSPVLSHFIGHILHDWLTYLNVITGFAQILQDQITEIDAEEQILYLQKIYWAVQQLVNNVVAMQAALGVS